MFDDAIDDFIRKQQQARAQSTASEDAWREAFRGFGQVHGTPTEDCFVVLGLRSGATAEMIQARYRELAKQHHPDKGGESAEFNRIKDARDRAMRFRERG
jgi:DnaJ-domain-containing protein 1